MKDSPYFPQAGLMLRVLPHVADESCFALKGGTAINMFVRDVPRLSVDIDLTYVKKDVARDAALREIGEALDRIAEAVKTSIGGTGVQKVLVGQEKIPKLVVSQGQTRIKVEPNTVIRGTVFDVQERSLSRRAQELFELDVSVPVVSMEDLYGGKLCAALDRQHPRDLFDVKQLLENEGITDGIRKGFIVYLASHDRPMNELLDPNRKDLHRTYEAEFRGMADVKMDVEDLEETLETSIETLKGTMTSSEKQFLVALKSGKPDWGLLGLDGIDSLPAIQWKLQNIQRLGQEKHAESLKRLRLKLGIGD